MERQLAELGYKVEHLGVAEPGNEFFCGGNDIRVLVGNKI